VTVYTWLWIALLVAIVVVELVALVDRAPGDTLSEHLWLWGATREPYGSLRGWVLVRRLVLFLVTGWLFLHLNRFAFF
jgi:hypothetical protein